MGGIAVTGTKLRRPPPAERIRLLSEGPKLNNTSETILEEMELERERQSK